MKILNRILVLVLALLVVAAPVIPQNTAQAATARATTIRLEKTQGSVGLKSQSGSKMSISAGMKLTAGNTVTTGGASYSWESLDGSKAIKEDQNSVITLKQKGSTNEILVKKGAVAFNVKVPLKKNEKMNIRTSTMVAGVRGTIGAVEVVSDSESILYLLEGKIELKSVNHVTGKVTTVTVKAGEKAVVKRMDAEYKENTRVVEVQKSKLDEEEVPVFARSYVKGSKSMQNRISATGKVSVPILIGTKTPCKSILPDGTVLEAASLNSSKDEASLKKQVENLVEEKIAAQAKIEEVLALTVEEILGTQTGGGGDTPIGGGGAPAPEPKTYSVNIKNAGVDDQVTVSSDQITTKASGAKTFSFTDVNSRTQEYIILQYEFNDNYYAFPVVEGLNEEDYTVYSVAGYNYGLDDPNGLKTFMLGLITDVLTMFSNTAYADERLLQDADSTLVESYRIFTTESASVEIMDLEGNSFFRSNGKNYAVILDEVVGTAIDQEIKIYNSTELESNDPVKIYGLNSKGNDEYEKALALSHLDTPDQQVAFFSDIRHDSTYNYVYCDVSTEEALLVTDTSNVYKFKTAPGGEVNINGTSYRVGSTSPSNPGDLGYYKFTSGDLAYIVYKGTLCSYTPGTNGKEYCIVDGVMYEIVSSSTGQTLQALSGSSTESIGYVSMPIGEGDFVIFHDRNYPYTVRREGTEFVTVPDEFGNYKGYQVLGEVRFTDEEFGAYYNYGQESYGASGEYTADLYAVYYNGKEYRMVNDRDSDYHLLERYFTKDEKKYKLTYADGKYMPVEYTPAP